MELGSWSLISAPSLLALIPLLVMIVLAIRGRSTATACAAGIIVAALIMGQDLKMMANIFATSMGSSTVFIGIIIMLGAGLGVLMTEARITQTMVYWIVKGIGVNTQAKGKLALILSSLTVCGLLGTNGGGNSVIAPIIIPSLAQLGVTPSVAAVLFKISGEMGLFLGPLTGVTLITCEVTGLSYGEFLLFAALPFTLVFLGAAWFATKRTQRRTEGTEQFVISDDMKDINTIQIAQRDKVNTIIFLLAVVGLVVYGVVTKQGTNYALIVMLILSILVGVLGRMAPDLITKNLAKGVASQANILLVFITIDVLLTMVTAGGGFDALGDLLGHLAGNNPTAIMLIACLVGGFGIEAAAVAEVQIIAEMFLGSAVAAGLPMTMFAVSIIAATRLTGSVYPTSNFAIAMGIGRSDNTKEVLQALWISCGVVCIALVIWSFLGVWILT